tara:strand:- start:284 stop:532 length:249 start_codon:yes stop_codon:yes gene_type:complete
MNMTTSEWVGSLGVALLLLAFSLNLFGWLPRASRLYHGLNVLGAGLACYASLIIEFLPFVVLEGTWALVAFTALIYPRQPAA